MFGAVCRLFNAVCQLFGAVYRYCLVPCADAAWCHVPILPWAVAHWCVLSIIGTRVVCSDRDLWRRCSAGCRELPAVMPGHMPIRSHTPPIHTYTWCKGSHGVPAVSVWALAAPILHDYENHIKTSTDYVVEES